MSGELPLDAELRAALVAVFSSPEPTPASEGALAPAPSISFVSI